MKKLSYLTFAVLTLFLVLTFPKSAKASSGPIGQNEIRTESGPGVGEITLMWRRVDATVTNYSLVYGTQSGKYTYGADKIGNIVTYTVKSLNPGQKYCFLLYPYLNDQINPSKNPELCETAASSTNTVVGTTGPYGRNLMTAVAGPASGQVTLNWTKYFSDTQSYSLVYGLKPGKYIYGVVDARDASNPNDSNFTFTVGMLNPGTRYYFALIPKLSSGQALYVTAEVSAISH